MIRLPASSIVLGQSDLRDFDARQRQRKVTFQHPATNQRIQGPLEVTHNAYRLNGAHSYTALNPKAASFVIRKAESEAGSETSSVIDGEPTLLTISLEQDLYNHDTIQLPQRPYRHAAENATVSERNTSSTPKQSFYYAGFMEDLPYDNDNLQRSSPFAPDDASTPPAQRPISSERTLALSPLISSQNSAISPELRPTSNLTAAIRTQLAASLSPGTLLTDSPRRRTFRHQTNSFSFEESEQDFNSEHSFSPSTVRSFEPSSTLSEFIEPRLPPPFSLMSRSSSRTESLPRYPEGDHPSYFTEPTLDASPARDLTNSPYQTRYTPPILAQPLQTTQSRISTRRLPSSTSEDHSISLSETFHHPPSSSLSPVVSPSITPVTVSTNKSRSDRLYGTSGEASRPYQVYDDDAPSLAQPQTPDQLPEARHRSRYHPSYTAPVIRSRLGLSGVSGDGAIDYQSPLRARRDSRSATVQSSMGSQLLEPYSGMLEEGFEGLYGGMENEDDRENWFAGFEHSNIRSRSWFTRRDS